MLDKEISHEWANLVKSADKRARVYFEQASIFRVDSYSHVS